MASEDIKDDQTSPLRNTMQEKRVSKETLAWSELLNDSKDDALWWCQWQPSSKKSLTNKLKRKRNPRWRLYSEWCSYESLVVPWIPTQRAENDHPRMVFVLVTDALSFGLPCCRLTGGAWSEVMRPFGCRRDGPSFVDHPSVPRCPSTMHRETTSTSWCWFCRRKLTWWNATDLVYKSSQ